MPQTATAHTHVPAALALVGGGALILSAMTAAPAWAHDTLIASTPEADEVLEDSPEEVILEFSGPGLTTGDNIPNTIWVTDEDGEHWEGETEVEGATMSTQLSEPLPDGEYEVLYHVVYSDGHNEELGFNFEVEAVVEDEEDDNTDLDDLNGDAGAEETEAPEGTDEAEAVEETTEPEDDAGAIEDDEASAELNGDQTATEEDDQFPFWSAVGIGAAVLALLIILLGLMRRKSRQSNQT